MGWGMLAGGLIGGYGQYKAGQDSKDLADANAVRIRMQANETIRKTKLSQKQQTGSIVARQGSSGFSLKSESVGTYLDAMKTEFKNNISWMERARDSGIAIEQQQGQNIYNQSKWNAAGTAFSAVGNFMSPK